MSVPSLSVGIPSSDLHQDSMTKLCLHVTPPSCLHVLWDSLDSLETEGIEDPGVFKELESSFTSLEYEAAVNSMKLKSALGLDQVDYSIISSFPENFASLLLQLFNSILAGVFPLNGSNL